MNNNHLYIGIPKPALNIDTNYYKRMVDEIRTPILQESIKNAMEVRRHTNTDAVEQIRNTVSKSLDMSYMKDILKDLNIDYTLSEYFKNINVSKSIQDAVKINLESFKFDFNVYDSNNKSSANETVVKMSDMKVESYTSIDNYTEVSMNNNPDFNTPETAPLPEKVNKSPFSLSRGGQRINEFVFRINETVFKVELQYFLPMFFDGTISYSTIVLIFTIHCLAAAMSNNFEKDKFDEKL